LRQGLRPKPGPRAEVASRDGYYLMDSTAWYPTVFRIEAAHAAEGHPRSKGDGLSWNKAAEDPEPERIECRLGSLLADAGSVIAR